MNVTAVFQTTPESYAAAVELTKQKIALNTIIVNVVQRFPNGVEDRREDEYLLENYFHDIELIELDEQTFRIRFYPHPGADRFWKDLMAETTHRITESGLASLKSIKKY